MQQQQQKRNIIFSLVFFTTNFNLQCRSNLSKCMRVPSQTSLFYCILFETTDRTNYVLQSICQYELRALRKLYFYWQSVQHETSSKFDLRSTVTPKHKTMQQPDIKMDYYCRVLRVKIAIEVFILYKYLIVIIYICTINRAKFEVN